MTTTPRKRPAAKSAAVKATPLAKKTIPLKTASTPVGKSTPPATRPLAQAFSKPKAEKSDKAKKPKMVRDSFTFPKTEYVVLDELKQRAIQLAHPIKKGELLRAGLKALLAMPDAAFLQALKAVPAIKTGRPKKA
jgi:hypothetical protein